MNCGKCCNLDVVCRQLRIQESWPCSGTCSQKSSVAGVAHEPALYGVRASTYLGLEKQEGLLGVNSRCKEARGHHLDVIPENGRQLYGSSYCVHMMILIFRHSMCNVMAIQSRTSLLPLPQDVVIVVWPGDGVQIHNAEDAVDAAILQSCPMLDSTEVVA